MNAELSEHPTSNPVRPRVGVAFLYHESHSFSPLATDLAAFEAEDHHRGERLRQVYEGTSTELGGFLAVLEERGADAIPLVAAAAMPSGEVTAEAYAILIHEFTSALVDANRSTPLDGLLIALHGSMVAESERDPEGAIVELARSIVGDDVPIAVTLDLHSNVSAKVAECNALIFGYKTYPHVDMHEQGTRAANAVLDVIGGAELFVRSVRLPMLLRSINMRTEEGPMADVVNFARKHERRGVTAVSPHSGFPYSDTECSGASVSVVASTAELAETTAREVAEYFWQQRQRFQVEVPSIEEALTEARSALAAGETPVVLADVADNPQSGGSADTTMLIRSVVAAGIGPFLVSALYDPEVIAVATEQGAGSVIEMELAGKASTAYGAPLKIAAEVMAVGDGVYRNDGPFNAGLTVATDGAAWLRIVRLDGSTTQFDAVVTGRPITANDPGLYRKLGIDLNAYDVLVWKVKNHFRAAFEPHVGRIVSVDAPGPAQTDFTQLDFKHTDRSRWPFNLERERGELTVDAPHGSSRPFTLRPATRYDLPDIAQFHVAVWQEAYAGLMDAGFLHDLSVERRLPEWEESLRLWPSYQILVAHSPSGKFLGFGSAANHDAEGALGLELHTLNLTAEARGTGLAAAMIGQLLGEKPAFAWVVSGNDRAVEFYRKVGFEPTDERRPDPESGVDDLRMVRGSDRGFAKLLKRKVNA